MKETLYMKIIHLLDRHRTWLEIESIATVRNHTIVRLSRAFGQPTELSVRE